MDYFVSKDGELYHWKAAKHKYIKREKKNGKWVYTYPYDTKAKPALTSRKPIDSKNFVVSGRNALNKKIMTNTAAKKTTSTPAPKVSKEYKEELAYNSQKNSFGGKSSASKTETAKKQSSSLSTPKKASSEYEAELAYNSQKNQYPSGSVTKTETKKSTEKKETILDKGGKWFSSALKSIVDGVDKLTGAAAKDDVSKAEKDKRDFEFKNFAYLRNTANKLGEEYRKLEDRISEKSKQVAADRSDYVKKQTVAAEKEEIRKQIADKLYPTSTPSGFMIPNQELTQPRINKLRSDLGKAEMEASDAWREAEKARRKLNVSNSGLKELEKKRGELEKSANDLWSNYYNALDTKDKLFERIKDAKEAYSDTPVGKLEKLPDKINDFVSDAAFEVEYAFDRAKDWVGDRLDDLYDATVGEAKDALGYDERSAVYTAETRLKKYKYELDDSIGNIFEDQERVSRTHSNLGGPDKDALSDLDTSIYWTEQNYLDYARSKRAYENAKAAYSVTPLAKLERWVDGVEGEESTVYDYQSPSRWTNAHLNERAKLVPEIVRTEAAKAAAEEADKKYQRAKKEYEEILKQHKADGEFYYNSSSGESNAAYKEASAAQERMESARAEANACAEAYTEAMANLDASSRAYTNIYGDYDDLREEILRGR